jgi:hypothetical protein
MIEQGTPFTWYFNDESRLTLSIFRSPVSGAYRLRRKENDLGYTCVIRTLSEHKTLEDAISASESLAITAK